MASHVENVHLGFMEMNVSNVLEPRIKWFVMEMVLVWMDPMEVDNAYVRIMKSTTLVMDVLIGPRRRRLRRRRRRVVRRRMRYRV